MIFGLSVALWLIASLISFNGERMSTVELRDYQNELIVGARQHFRAGRMRVLLQLATGGGKTATTARMIKNAVERGRRTWFNVHRRELAAQVAKALQKEGIEYGLVMPGARVNLDAPVQINSIPTLVNRLDRMPPPDFIVFDECHHVAAGSWSKIAQAFPKAYQLGLSATPQRLDGAGLLDYFDAMVCGPSVSWLIENGYLCDFRLFSPNTIDRDRIGKLAGEFRKDQSSEIMSDPKIVGDVISHYRQHAPGSRGLAFCTSVKTSQQYAAKFTESGTPAVHIDGKTHDNVRDKIMEDFEAGHIRVLCNVDLFGEGYDCPALETVMLLRPTMSLAMYLQQIGRALRPAPGKAFATILDHVGNSDFHGDPDIDREWKLTTGKASKKSDETPSPRVCSTCYAHNRAGAQRCKICGSMFPVQSREIDEVSGELTEKEIERRTRNQMADLAAQAQDLDGLLFIAKQKGYKDPAAWAQWIMDQRKKEKARGARISDGQKKRWGT